MGIKLERALELKQLALCSGNMFLPDIQPETPDERKFITNVWKTMPKSTCYFEVICKLCDQLKENKEIKKIIKEKSSIKKGVINI